MAFFNKSHSIHKGVMGIVKKRIAEAQAEHDKECEAADLRCEADKKAAEQQREDAKEISAHKSITKVLGKLI